MMTREQLLMVGGVKTSEVEIEGVGTVRLREMSGQDRDEYFGLLCRASRISHEGKEVPDIFAAGAKPFLVARCVVDSADQPVFAGPADAGKNLRPECLDAIFDAINEINALSDKEQKETEKN